MSGYPIDRLYEELSFLAYYLHWPHGELMGLAHAERLRFCREVSSINGRLNGEDGRENVFEVSL